MERGEDLAREGDVPYHPGPLALLDQVAVLGVELEDPSSRVHLTAPGPDENGVEVESSGETRPEHEARLRALRSLRRMGLLWAGDWTREVTTRQVTVGTWERYEGRTYLVGRGKPVKRRYVTRCYGLTPLGAAVVDRLRASLEAGKRIRWNGVREALAEAARHGPADLLREFGEALRPERDRLRKHVSICRQLAAGGYPPNRQAHLRSIEAWQAHERACEAIDVLAGVPSAAA